MAKLKTLTIDSVANNVPVIEVGDYIKYNDTLGKIEQVPVHSVTSGSPAISVPSGSTGKDVEVYTIPCDGIAICRGTGDFPSNTTGYRHLRVGYSRGGSWLGYATMRASPCSGGSTILSATEVLPVLKNDTVTLSLLQTSGSAMNVKYAYNIIIFPKTYE